MPLSRAKHREVLAALAMKLQLRADRYAELALTAATPKQRRRWGQLAATRNRIKETISAKRNALAL